MPRVTVVLALVVLMAVLPGAAHAEKTLGISTGKFEFSVASGEGGSGELYVVNDGDEPIEVLVYAANQTVDENGEISYQVPSRDDPGLAFDPANWMSIKTPTSNQTVGNTPMIELLPGESAPVEFTFTVPQGVPPGDHQVILFFEMVGEPRELQETGAEIVGRVGARVRVRVQGEVVERLEVRPFVLRTLIIGSKAPFTFVIRNAGNTDKQVSVNMMMLDGSGNEVSASTIVTETVVYAGTVAEHSGVLDPEVSLGRFTARLVVDYTRESATGAALTDALIEERTVWVFPLWLVIVVISGVGLALVYWSWRAAVRKAERRTRKRHERRASRGEEAISTVSPDHDPPSGLEE